MARRERLLRGALLAAVLSGCAIADTGSFVRVQEEVVALKRDVAALQAAQAPPPASSPAVPEEVSGEISSLRKSLADLASENERLRGEVLATGTRADEAKVEMQREVSRLNTQVTELGQEVGKLGGKAPGGEDLERRVAALEEKVSKISSGAPPGPGAAGPPPAEWKGPEEMYEYSLGLIKGGETKKGREVLNQFAAKYPEHRLMQNVFYWKGETFYAEKDYESAILSFQDVIDKFPGGDKSPDAMYKQGLSFLAIRDTKNAKILFELVQTKYPASPAAGLAKKKLSEIR